MYSFRQVTWTFAAIGLCSLGSLPLVQAQTYTITDLGTLGGTSSFATALNSQGDVVGAATTAGGNEHAFLWHNGVISDLGVAPGFTSSIAWDINNAGQTVGDVFINNSSSFHAFYYSGGVLQDIGAIGAPTNFPTQSIAWGINNAGQVAGHTTVPNNFTQHAFVWDAVHGYTDLSPNVSLSGSAQAINDAGMAVGQYDYESSTYSGSTHQLITPGSGQANNVNNSNAVVGGTSNTIFGNNINYGHAYVWQNGQLTDLGTLPGFGGSTAQAINDAGVIVGNVFNLDSIGEFTAQDAFIDTGSGLVDLNTLLPGNSGWKLTYARDINNADQIVGLGSLNGQQHAYLLNPATAVPEPTSLALLVGMGLFGANFLVCRKKASKAV